jgi:hypothetical protein
MEYFVKPLEVLEPFSTFLNDIRQQENTREDSRLVKYAQTRESQPATVDSRASSLTAIVKRTITYVGSTPPYWETWRRI